MYDEKRAFRLKQAADKWKVNKGKGTIVAVTGVGKTSLTIENIIKPLLEKTTDNVLVIVSTGALKIQWEERINDERVTVEVVNTAIKTINREFGLIVYDEVHRYRAPEFSKCFLIRAKWKLCLTGSLDKEMEEILNKKNLPVVDRITRKEALENKWISDYVEFNLAINLDLQTTTKLDKLEKEYERKLKSITTFGFPNISNILTFETVEGKKVYSYAQELADAKNLPVGAIIGIARRLKLLATAKNNLVYDYYGKYEALTQLVNLFKDKKIITFSLQNKSAEEAKRITGGETLLKKDSLKKFMSGETMLLHTCRKLNEGSDIPNLEVAINIAYYSKPNSNIQRLGRIIRKEEDKLSIFINLYTRCHPKIKSFTPEQYWLNLSQKERQDDVIWVNSVEEIVNFLNSINGSSISKHKE